MSGAPREPLPEVILGEHEIMPYGDTTNDGRVQLSFTLPIADGPRAEAAAQQLAQRMGFHDIHVATRQEVTPGYTWFVVFGATCHSVDLELLDVHERAFPRMTAGEIDATVRGALGRRCVVLGANIETDAHTVGLDAILNVKGFAGDKGLEYHHAFDVTNLGAQVDSQRLVELAAEHDADAVLISQVVTEKDAHRHHLGRFVELLEASGRRDRTIVVAGGPRLHPKLAGELGLDAVFGKGTSPTDVASYLAHELQRRAGSGS